MVGRLHDGARAVAAQGVGQAHEQLRGERREEMMGWDWDCGERMGLRWVEASTVVATAAARLREAR